MRVTSVQLAIENRSKGETLEYVAALLEQTRGSDLVLLPELWPTGYFSFDRYEKEAETLDGEIVQRMRHTASRLKQYLFIGSMVERDGEHLYNTCVLIDSGGEVAGKYRKLHLFGYQSEESRLLTRGTEIVVVQTPWGKAGLSTCYDLRFPELYRKMIDLGAAFFLVCAAWPEARREAWILFNRARAHENLAFLFSCNCAGSSQGRKFAGHSMFVDPLGQVISEAGDAERLVSSDIDIQLVSSVRRDFSVLEDRVLKP